MGIPSLLDGIVLAPAAILGVLGVWLGFGRSLVAWPMRWLIPLFAACLAILPAALPLALYGERAAVLHLSGTAVATAIGAISFLVTIVLLAMFMGNLRERMAVWTGNRRIGLTARVGGGLFGIACGLLLVAIPYAVYDSLQPDPNQNPAWTRDSVSLAYFRDASEAVKSAVSEYLPSTPGKSRR